MRVSMVAIRGKVGYLVWHEFTNECQYLDFYLILVKLHRDDPLIFQLEINSGSQIEKKSTQNLTCTLPRVASTISHGGGTGVT